MNDVVARPKGPLVWLDMDQQELDDAYDQLKYAANAQQLGHRRMVEGAQVRARLGEPRQISYGPSAIETLNLFHLEICVTIQQNLFFLHRLNS